MDEDNYEEFRRKNIAERKSIFAELFSDIKEQTEQFKKIQKEQSSESESENQPPKKRRRKVLRNSDSFNVKVHLNFRRRYNTRNNKKQYKNESHDSEDDDDSDSPISLKDNRPKLQVLFPWAKPFERVLELMKMGVCDVDQETEEERDVRRKSRQCDDFIENVRTRRSGRRASKYNSDEVPSVDEVTEKMLDNVAMKSTDKVYCTRRGTSCHQCRQKTLDTKTICRSGECVGVRGQFCGPCLKGRYGEYAVEALKDPDWACPPCRGLCNCSLCRTKNGNRPTGILAPVVKKVGYSSVMDYLQAADLGSEDE